MRGQKDAVISHRQRTETGLTSDLKLIDTKDTAGRPAEKLRILSVASLCESVLKIRLDN